MAKLSLAEKLDWLEEAHRMVLRFEQARAKRAAGQVREKPGTEG